MQMILLSEATAARRTLYFLAANTADDSAYTSTLTGADIKISIAGSAEANSTGTATHIANGLFKYVFEAAEVATLGAGSLRLAKTGVYGDVYTFQVVAVNPYDAAAFGMSNLDATITSRLADEDYSEPGAAVLAAAVFSGVSLQTTLQRIFAGAAGKRAGIGSGIEYYYDPPGTTAIITATIDASGNTTAITYGAP
jgi:hypothetical protein